VSLRQPVLLRVVFAACLAGGLANAGPAYASGFAAAEFGGEHGNVVTTNPTALYFNPAGIALSDGTRIYVSGVLALRRAGWSHAQAASELPEPPGAEGADTGQARFSNLFGAPALAATTRIRRLAIGGAFYVPFGGRVHWDPNPRFANDPAFPLAADGVQRWHIIQGAVTSMYFTVGAALRLGPVAIGVTGNLVRTSVENRQAKSFGPQVVDPLNEGRIGIDVAGIHASFGLGAMFEAVRERLWLGASYQAQPGMGPMKLHGLLSASLGSDVAEPRPITYTQALPDIVRAGIRVRPSTGRRAVELRLYGDLTRWSRLQTQCVSGWPLDGPPRIGDPPCAVFPDGTDATPESTTIQNIRRRWRDSYGAHLGASFWTSERVELFAGVGFATAATPDATLDPMMPDANNLRIAVGGRFALPAGFHVTTGLTSVQYASRDNTGRSVLADAELPTRRPDGGGQYQLWLGLFHVGLEKQL
jgi:long-chain fatty acid transport protein